MNSFRSRFYCFVLLISVCGVAFGQSAEDFAKSVVPLRQELQQIKADLPSEEILNKIPADPWRNYAGQILQQAENKCDEIEKAFGKTTKSKLRGDDLDYACMLRDTGIRPLKAAVQNLQKLVGVTDPLLVFIKTEPITNYRVVHNTKLIDGVIGDNYQHVCLSWRI